MKKFIYSVQYSMFKSIEKELPNVVNYLRGESAEFIQKTKKLARMRIQTQNLSAQNQTLLSTKHFIVNENFSKLKELNSFKTSLNFNDSISTI